MLDRLVDKTENINDKAYLLDGNYDYAPVNAIIDEKRRESLEWLRKSLAVKHDATAGLYDFVNNRIKEMDRKLSELRHKNKLLEDEIKELREKGDKNNG
jgi:predicted ribosome quality control (RQC) complex YloA/Tae2 family protein